MAPLASDWRGGFQGYFRRASGEVARQFMTPLQHLPDGNPALHKSRRDARQVVSYRALGWR